jgi:hypothetical protein
MNQEKAKEYLKEKKGRNPVIEKLIDEATKKHKETKGAKLFLTKRKIPYKIEYTVDKANFNLDLVELLSDFAEQDKREISVNFLIHMLKKYEGHDIIEQWHMEDDFR